eukprot:GFUD01034560.1.p1 GENE.GFUD01034560.1~~GFUD01034560.1.p1  ORF type:complete len:378 (-),score=61.50 GFUD01034560.1:122-1255(-)
MTAPTQNYVTMCYDGSQGDREFVLTCKGRPFSVLTAPQFPTPAVTMVDYTLVRDLKLRMTDLQCAKLLYGGQKLRILGRISTSVQCISDGISAGNLYFKAIVIQDLYQTFVTHSIASTKLSGKLIGPPFEVISTTSTEPTKDKAPKKMKAKTKKKIKVTEDLTDNPFIPTVSPHSDTDSSLDLQRSPSPRCQGRWIQHQYHHGWHPAQGYRKRGQLKNRYEDRLTGKMTFERPATFQSDGSFHSPGSARSFDPSDEYVDEYTNVSYVRCNPPAMPPASFGPAKAKQFTPAELRRRRDQFKDGLLHRDQTTPENLRQVPIPHGSEWCDPDCLWQGEENLPTECGYHPNFGRIVNCSASCCPGGWCPHTRQMEGRDYMS